MLLEQLTIIFTSYFVVYTNSSISHDRCAEWKSRLSLRDYYFFYYYYLFLLSVMCNITVGPESAVKLWCICGPWAGNTIF